MTKSRDRLELKLNKQYPRKSFGRYRLKCKMIKIKVCTLLSTQ